MKLLTKLGVDDELSEVLVAIQCSINKARHIYGVGGAFIMSSGPRQHAWLDS
jgi:hypothetical protein